MVLFMAKLICKKCDHEYDKNDKTCPNCMAVIDDAQEEQLTEHRQNHNKSSDISTDKISFSEFKKLNKEEKKTFFNQGGKITYSKKDKIIIALGVTFFCLFALGVLSVINAPEKPKTAEQIASEAAENAERKLTSELEATCVNNVIARLKLPDTIEIDYGSLKTNMKNDLNGYAVYFKFTAENKYSMTVHNEALCTFKANKKIIKVVIR